MSFFPEYDFYSDLEEFQPNEVQPALKPQSYDFYSDLDLEEPNETNQPKKQKPEKAYDFFADLETPSPEAVKAEKPSLIKKSKQSMSVYAEEKTPEELKHMSVSERLQYAKDLTTQREFGESKGITKGALSGASFGLSEKIPGLSPEEGEFLTGFGEFAGSVLPISKLYSFLGKPLVKLAAKSPVARRGVEALARMTGFGLTGAAYEGAKEAVKTGEVPSPNELLKHGAQWAAFDGALQLVGKAATFLPKLKKYSQGIEIPEKEAVNQIVDTLQREKINPLENPEAAIKRAEEIISPEAEIAPIKAKPANMQFEAIEPSSQKIKTAAKEIDSIPADKRTPEQTQIKALSEEAQPGDPPEKLFKDVPIPDEPSFKNYAKAAFLKPKSKLAENLNKKKQDYFSKKWGLEWDSRNKWDKMLKEKKFSKQELSDMQFYIENPEVLGGKKTDPGTGNPFVGSEDTFETLQGRLSPESKKAVHEVIQPHFKQWVKTINESAYTKKINPRDFLEGVYIPHFYSGDSKKGAKQAAEMISKRFSTNNPFANMRTFMSYNEALQKAGMKPRFDNIADLLNEYDRVMTRVLVNSEFAGQIADLEKEIGSKFIIRSNSPKYAEAKRDGWVPFDDPYLRRYVAGTNAKGEPVWATLDTPALVHPEAADAFTGIFIKDAQKPRNGGEMALWKPFDALSDLLKSAHVSFSGFHYLTLAEESAKSSGVNLYRNFIKGGKLLEDPVFMREFVSSGGTVGHNPELIKKGSSNVDALDKSMRLFGGATQKVGNAIKGIKEILQGPSKFLFEEFQPRMKVAAFYDMRGRYLNQLNKKGIVPDAAQMKQINRELASLSNDMFGGQRFELMQNPTNFKALDLNDPSVLRAWRRAGGYVDWSVSALKEFAKTAKGVAELLPGVKETPTGTIARQNFWRYARNLFIGTQMMNYLFTGLKKDKDGKITWDYSKAHSTFENEDPSKRSFPYLDFQLPDLEFDIGGHKFNAGRDSRGRKLYSHFGKKLLEIFHYGSDPIKALFNKSNPVWQTLFVQAAGGTPSLEGVPFKEQGKYSHGETKPWEGKAGWSTLKPRLKHLFRTSLPFSLQRIQQEGVLGGISQFLTTGLGALPIKKGLSTRGAEEYYFKYLKNEERYEEEIKALDEMLRDNGYPEASIKSTKTRVRNRLKEEKGL